ncbi:hypothetical protein PAMP_021434 [Pampus punctatissimus]
MTHEFDEWLHSLQLSLISCRIPPPPVNHHMTLDYIFTSPRYEHSLLPLKSPRSPSINATVLRCQRSPLPFMLKEQTALQSQRVKIAVMGKAEVFYLILHVS